MSVRDGIVSAVRAWLKTAAGLTDAQCIKADTDGTRPALPYLVVKCTLADLPDGEDEDVDTVADDAPAVFQAGNREATVSVHGYGAETEDWMQIARAALRRYEIQTVLTAHGVTVHPLGGITDMSAFLDTGTQPRFLMEATVVYGIENEPEPFPELAPDGVKVEQTYTGNGDDIPDTIEA